METNKCIATTRKNTKCTKKAINDTNFCFNHKNHEYVTPEEQDKYKMCILYYIRAHQPTLLIKFHENYSGTTKQKNIFYIAKIAEPSKKTHQTNGLKGKKIWKSKKDLSYVFGKATTKFLNFLGMKSQFNFLEKNKTTQEVSFSHIVFFVDKNRANVVRRG